MPVTTTTNDAIATAVEFAESAKKRLLNTLENVPDDKLTWTPSPTAHSALRIAAHAAISNDHFKKAIAKEPVAADVPLEEIFKQVEALETAVTSRARVVSMIEEKASAAIAALKKLSPSDMAGEVSTPFGPMSMTFIVTLIGRHMDDHAAQIDYLQTIWGDGAMHF